MRQLLLVVALTAGSLLLAGCFEPEPIEVQPTVAGQVMDRADRSGCEQYVAQLNQAAQMYQVNHETYPPDLATVVKESGLPASELQDCKFKYDPATGKVTLVR